MKKKKKIERAMSAAENEWHKQQQTQSHQNAPLSFFCARKKAQQISTHDSWAGQLLTQKRTHSLFVFFWIDGKFSRFQILQERHRRIETHEQVARLVIHGSGVSEVLNVFHTGQEQRRVRFL